jgi:hypothetical protein
VSKKFTPSSKARFRDSSASRSSIPPIQSVPKQILDTVRPVQPSFAYVVLSSSGAQALQAEML